MKTIVIFPGSFKPPHKGHFKVVSTLVHKESVDLLYIIISNKPRPLLVKYLDLAKKPSSNIEQLTTELKHKYVTKKNALKVLKEEICSPKIECITANQSYEIWQLYIHTLPEKYQNKIKLRISVEPSPILTTLNIIKRLSTKIDYEVILIKSDKDQSNSRFKSIEDKLSRKNLVIKEEIIPNFKTLNSRNFRAAIEQKNKKDIDMFIPPKVNKEAIYKILNIK